MPAVPTSRFLIGDWLLALVMCSGAYVMVEPAPFDVALVGVGLVVLVTRGRVRISKSALFPLLLLLLFAIANIAALLTMSDSDSGLRFMAITFYLMVVWAVVVAAQAKFGARSLDAMMWGIAVGGGVAAGAGIAAYLGAPVLGPLMVKSGRLFGMFKDPNVFGAYLVPVALIGITHLVGRVSRRRLVWLTIVGLSCAAVFLTGSRGAWVNLAVSVVAFFLLFTFADGFSRVWWRTLLFFPAVIAVFAVVATELVSVQAVADMMHWRFGMQSYDDVRFATQARVFDIALQNPLGLGPGGTGSASTRAAHNVYLTTLVETGILGAISVTLFIVSSTARAVWVAVSSRDLQDRLRFAVVGATLTGILVESTVIDTIHWRHLWIFCAFAWAVAAPARRRRPDAIRGAAGRA